ncbi:hypothetical protein R3X27_21030 [Tropicimonas sp. TH_r6]|uniref:hypothetical protein n=1 Tax=Tropicimonas sp. TH_r6 TaxID=3082085 RepID=UPI0029535071|nr:hypothetical protein [Tropicimonas sp. TH_r6]MDV7145174.1 hypothetical protein [Tropicimonas sp. TH_r6]
MDISDITAAVIKRAEAAGFETDVHEFQFEDEKGVNFYIFFPAGREKRRIGLSSGNRASRLHSIEFERFSFLGGFEAIVDLKKGEIEAAISPREPFSIAALERRLGIALASGSDEEEGSDEEVAFALRAERPDGVSVEISRCTEELNALTTGPRARTLLSLKISLGGERKHASALKALETISNSLFFQLDVERGVALALRKTYRRHRPVRSRSSSADETTSIQFPAFEYDEAPISLYWYAKSARGMPLLQFLAYYQVVEYYFPNFSKLEAVRSARKILKHPSFRVDRESDLTKLVATISGNGRVGTSEREQMKVTVLEVLSSDDVKQFFDDNEEISELLGKKRKGITDKTVNIARKDHDHRADIAELLYDIRCRIVHTKNGFEGLQPEMILPFSAAEEDMWAYTELMQFVAQNALVRSSSVLGSV